MADSDFWRELAISFQSAANLYEFAAHRLYCMELSIVEPTWNLPAPPAARAEFDALARRGASMLSPSPTGDLALAWLEALWREATHGPVRTPSEIVGKDRTGQLTQLHGKIDRVFQSSSALCRKFESEALQSEFEEKRRDDPRNWTPFRQRYEAFKSLKEIINEPAERISEVWVRNAIARIHGIKPEDVTLKQIRFEIAGLLSSTKRHIEMIPSALQGSPPVPEPDTKLSDQPEPIPVPVSPPVETIAAQLQRLRMECNWTIEKLAAKTGFDEKTVKRHLSGRVSPRLGNLTIYQQAFSKALKREVVIEKMPPKRPLNAP